MPGAGDLQTQLEDTRRQLDNAEREKQLLADKIRTSPGSRVRDRRKCRAGASSPRRAIPACAGRVLAVNQAYNFVVLNLGGRQGVEANSEMLVLRARSAHRQNPRLLS